MASTTKSRWIFGLLGILLSIAVYYILDIPASPKMTASIFTLIVFYWITEAIPIYISAILGAFLMMVAFGPLSEVMGVDAINYKMLLCPFSGPVILLMAGGFYVAQIFSKYRLDVRFSKYIILKLGRNPKVILLGIIFLTALLSMWMSNTATTAIMVAAMLPVIKKLPPRSNIAKSLMLSIPFAANIGGIGTPIGTPPNAIAIGALASQNISISFLSWMIRAVPIMLIFLLFLWVVLLLIFPPKVTSLDIEIESNSTSDPRSTTIILIVFFIMVALWLTDKLHGIPSALVAVLPIIVFSIFGISGKRDLRGISWEILLLIGGGLSMGLAIQKTGLSDIIVASLNLKMLSPMMAAFFICGLIAIMATFMSHTASANLIVPLAVTISAVNPSYFAITAALCSSYGMGLPISTPPNAIAYGSGYIETKDMVRAGAIITIFATVITVVYQYYFFMGVK